MPHHLDGNGKSKAGSQIGGALARPSDVRRPAAQARGAVAQLGEHLLCKEGVRSSSLLGSTAPDRAATSVDPPGRAASALYVAVAHGVNSAVPAPDSSGLRPSRRFVPKTPHSGPRTTYSCARPNEWCSLKSEEEDKRELQFRRRRNVPITNTRTIFETSTRSTTGLDVGL